MLRDLGLSGQFHPVQADARALPFEDGFFDVIVSIDAWEYFGTDDHFLPGLLRVLRPGGAIGMATPAMARDVRDLGAIPKHIEEVVGRSEEHTSELQSLMRISYAGFGLTQITIEHKRYR